MFKHIRYFYVMSRPVNVFIAVMTILIAAMVTGNFQFNSKLLYAMLTAAFITCGANIINDLFDVEIDRINKPKRILPAGLIGKNQAWWYFNLAYIIALSLALLSSWSMFFIAVLIALLLYLYSAYLKRTVLWGNLAVSFSTAMAFIYGALAVEDWLAGIIPALFAFFFHFGREIIKDMQDLEGDLANKAITFPGKYGKKKSIFLINLIFILLIFLTIIPYILHIYNIQYLWVVLIGVDTVLLGTAVILWFKHEATMLGRLSHLLKLDMIIGLLAIYLGVNDAIFFN